MSIQQAWWPAVFPPDDSVHINKEQAGCLISLAMHIDGEKPPANIPLVKSGQGLGYKGGIAVASNWVLAPSAKSDVYRKYCSELWKRCSDSVKLMYMIMGIGPAVHYLLSIVNGIERLRHSSEEIKQDWEKCVVCLLTANKNIGAIREKIAQDAILPHVDKKARPRSPLFVDHKTFDEQRRRLPDEELPLVTDEREKAFTELLKVGPQQLQEYYGDQTELPKPSVTDDSDAADRGTNMALAIGDPIWAGVPPYKGLLSDEAWVYANMMLMQQIGPAQWLVNLLSMLRGTYGYHFTFDENEVEEYDGKKEGQNATGSLPDGLFGFQDDM